MFFHAKSSLETGGRDDQVVVGPEEYSGMGSDQVVAREKRSQMGTTVSLCNFCNSPAVRNREPRIHYRYCVHNCGMALNASIVKWSISVTQGSWKERLRQHSWAYWQISTGLFLARHSHSKCLLYARFSTHWNLCSVSTIWWTCRWAGSHRAGPIRHASVDKTALFLF